MYRLRIFISPDKGVEPTALQTEGRSRGGLEPIAFFVKLQREIERFRRRVGRILDLPPQGKAKNGKSDL